MGETLVANELLAFLQQKLDVMDELSAVQICSTNFKVDDICKAKALLCESLKMSAKCIPHRRGDENGKKSLQDIINILKETDPDDVPTFVAKDLYKLPPVTFNHVDVTGLLKDITTLKASLEEFKHKFEVSQSTIAELREEVVMLRNSVTRSADDSNYVNERRGARAGESTTSASTAPSADLPAHGTPRAERTDPPPARAPPAAAAPHDPPRPAAPPPPPAPDAAAYSAKLRQRPRRNIASRPQKLPTLHAAATKKARPTLVEPTQNKRCDQVDADGFTLVEKKRRKRNSRNKCGTAPAEPNLPLRAATPKTSLYVSRLHETCTVQDVLDYIFARHKAGVFKDSPRLGVCVEALESRHRVSFNSFVVRVPTAHLAVFTSPEFWPKGVVFRRFRGNTRRTAPESA